MARKTRRSLVKSARVAGCFVVVDTETRDVTVSSANGVISIPTKNAVTLWVIETLREAGWTVEPLDVRDALWQSL